MKLLGLPRRYKRMLQVAADVSLVWLSLWLAFLVRLGTEDMISPFGGHAWLFIAAPLVAIPLFIRFGMYRAVMRYLGNDALIAIAKAVTISRAGPVVAGLLVPLPAGGGAAFPGVQLLVVEHAADRRLASGHAPVFHGRLVLCCAVGTISQPPGWPAQGGYLWRGGGRQPVGCGVASRSGDASGGVHR